MRYLRYFIFLLLLSSSLFAQTQIDSTRIRNKNYIYANDPPYNAKGNSTTDDTSAIQAALTAAASAGKCLYIPGTTSTYPYVPTTGSYVTPSPAYKLTGTITGPATGNVCIIMDPNTALVQTTDADTLVLRGSNNTVTDGMIFYTAAATSRNGITMQDTATISATNNRVFRTKIYGALVTGRLGRCFNAESNYSTGAYSNSLYEIYGQFCGVGVRQVGAGGANSYLNLGEITGTIDNSDQQALLDNAGEKSISLSGNGNQLGILIRNNVGTTVLDTRGGESAGYRTKFESTAFGNIYIRPGTALANQVIDDSNGLNQIQTMDGVTSVVDTSGVVHVCLVGCFSNSNFPIVNPRYARVSWFRNAANPDSLAIWRSNSGGVPTAADLLWNPYGASYNSPWGGLYLRGESTFPTTNPLKTLEYTNSSNTIWRDTRLVNNGVAMGNAFIAYANNGATAHKVFGLAPYNASGAETVTFAARSDGAVGNSIYVTVSNLSTIYGGCNVTQNNIAGGFGTALTEVNVTDLANPVIGAAPTGGGTATGKVICINDGSGPSWRVSAAASNGSTVYRCATAGATLPTGSLTINAAACGTTVDTGFKAQ